MPAIRTEKLEVAQIKGDHKAIRQLWYAQSTDCQRAKNAIWRTWEHWHFVNDSPAKIRVYLDALKVYRDKQNEHKKQVAAWEKTKSGPKPKKPKIKKPKLDFSAVPPQLQKEMTSAVAAVAPNLHSRVVTLLTNTVVQTIKSRKAAKGNLSGWMAILLDHEGRPASIHPQPIPFDVQNSTLIAPTEKGGKYGMSLRTYRYALPGKSRCKSEEHTFTILTHRRKTRSQQLILSRICDGTYKFCGSNLLYQKGKWFIALAYEMDVKEPAVGDAVAVLRPGRYNTHPVRKGRPRLWVLQIGNRKIRIGGTGSHVGGMRDHVVGKRLAYQEHYRHASSARKGHGRKRALKGMRQWHFRQAWTGFVKRANQNMTTRVRKLCQEHGVGKVVYLQPVGEKKDSRFLSRAGKIEDREDSTGWDWHQVAALLNYKLKDCGIELEVRKAGEPKSPQAADGQADEQSAA